MSINNVNVCKALMAREIGRRRPGTATGQSRRLYQSICPSIKVQQLEVPDAHICRFSPCGQYLVCMAGGFTQLVVYRFTGPRVSWQGELSEAELISRLASFNRFFSLLYRLPLAPAGEVLARDVVLFMAGGSLLLLVSNSPFAPPGASPPPDADPLQALPFAKSITLHLVQLSDGVRVGGIRLESELVDLSGRPGSLGVSVHEDLIAVLALRSQVIHLLQVLRGGEEVVAVRSLGPHVAEDDELVLRTAQEAEERWLRTRRVEREAAPADAAAAAPLLRRSYNGDLVRATDQAPATVSLQPAAVAATAQGTARHHNQGLIAPAVAAAVSVEGGGPGWSRGRSSPASPRYGAVDLGLGAAAGTGWRQEVAAAVEVLQGGSPGGAAAPVLSPQVAIATAGRDPDPDLAAAWDGSTGAGSGSAAGLMAPPVAVLYPPERADVGSAALAAAAAAGEASGSSRVATAADLAVAAAHQAAVRRLARQQQYEQLAAQGGPEHPPPPAQRSLQLGGGALHSDLRINRAAHEAAAPAPAGMPPVLLRQYRNHQQQQQQHFNNADLLQQPQQLQPQQLQRQPHAPYRGPHQQRHHNHSLPHHQPLGPSASTRRHPALQQPLYPYQRPVPGPGLGRPLVPPDGGGEAAGGNTLGGGGGGAGGGSITGIKQRLLAHLYLNCLRAHPNNPRRQQREALVLFRQLDTYRSLVMRKVYILDRSRLLIDMRKPAGADLGPSAFGGTATAPPGGGPGLPPSQFFLLFDLQTTGVLSFAACPGDGVIESYIREATSAAVEPWAESLPLWDRYVYDNVMMAARSKLRGDSGGGGGGGGPSVGAAGLMSPGLVLGGAGAGTIEAAVLGAAPSAGGGAAVAFVERVSGAGKLMQLLPPLSGSCRLSSSPYLDTCLFNYDERVVSPCIRTRACMEQPVFFRLRNRPDRAMFRLDPGPYEAMVVRDRRLARNVTYLFHPEAPFVLVVFGVFQQSTLNINFRL